MVYVNHIDVASDSCQDVNNIEVCDPEPRKRTGLQTLKNIDEVSIIAVPRAPRTEDRAFDDANRKVLNFRSTLSPI